jgi:outer membrane protein insertion porin family/translocation and assembly module TamA
MRSKTRASLSLIVAIGLAELLGGCNSIPEGRSSVDAVTVRGAKKVDAGDVEDKVATTSSEKFLGLFRGVLYEYSTFDRFVLQKDLARVEAFYRTKGYYEAHARAGRVFVKDDKHVEVEIVVEEGPVVTVRDVRVQGLDGLPKDVIDAAIRGANAALRKDAPFEEEQFTKAEGNVRSALADRGYAYVQVKSDAAVDIVRHVADAIFTVTPGPTCKLGPISVEGLGELPESKIRQTADLDEGDPFSQDTLIDAQQALLDLGVFASVSVEPQLPQPPRADRKVPITIKLEPSRLRTIRLGGGIEFDALKSDVHGIVGWEDRNFLGGLRTFSIKFRPGVVLYPLRVNNITLPERFLPEERLRLELRQPGFVEARTTGFIHPEFNVQGLFIDPNPPPGARVLGYAEFRNGVGLDRTIWKLYAAVSHNLQVAEPFMYVGSKDPTLGLLVISYPELLTNLDFRDDKVHPRKGFFLGNTFQFAGGPFGGQADDIKVQPDVRGYVPISKRVVFASRASIGLLLARNYGDVVRNPASMFDGSEARTRDYQLTFFRGFFSGGPTQNRGYPLRGISPHDFVPFITPELLAQQLSTACGTGGFDCRTPTGGFTLWEASGEFRFAVSGPLSVATFCDASDVSPQTADIRLKHLHLSCGGGGRYDTPVGPIRLDIGYRIPGMQVLGGLTRDEREPQTFPFGIPIAVHIGIGEAY